MSLAPTGWSTKTGFVGLLMLKVSKHVDGSERESTRPILSEKKARDRLKEGQTAEGDFEVVEELTAEDKMKLEV